MIKIAIGVFIGFAITYLALNPDKDVTDVMQMSKEAVHSTASDLNKGTKTVMELTR